MKSQSKTQERKGLNETHNYPSKGKSTFTGSVGYDFSITGTTKSGQKITATIPAGTPRKQLLELFEIIGYQHKNEL